jgi:hypothetical protein
MYIQSYQIYLNARENLILINVQIEQQIFFIIK